LIARLRDDQGRPRTGVCGHDLLGGDHVGVDDGLRAVHRQIAFEPSVPYDMQLLRRGRDPNADVVGMRLNINTDAGTHKDQGV